MPSASTEQLGDRRRPWWMSAVCYEVYVRSFADSDGSGEGDLAGVREHLDHLEWLGVDALWLCPFYPSPMVDSGYDVADFCDVDPRFGSLPEFDRLLADAHARGIRVLVDWVPNHSSDQHPWFLDARSGRDAEHRDWYYWRDEPTNWRAAIDLGSTWTLDEDTEQYYLHFFLPQQPDLNWTNPRVVEAMHDTLRFWLARGVDGFRIDSVQCLGKDLTFSDNDRSLAGEPINSFNDQPETHEMLRDIRALVERENPEAVLVGEVNLRREASIVQYYGHGDELNLTFNFPPLDAPWDPIVWRSIIAEIEHRLVPRTHGRSGPLPITTIRGCGPGMADRSIVPAPPSCCCSPCAARCSSTRARNSASPTSTCAGPHGATRADVTAPADRSRGPGRHPTAGPATHPGCRSPPTRAPTASRPSGTTPTRSCT